MTRCCRAAKGCHPRVFFFDLDIQPADFLIQCGERHLKALGGFSLVPVALLQHVADDAPLDVFHDFKQ